MAEKPSLTHSTRPATSSRIVPLEVARAIRARRLSRSDPVRDATPSAPTK
uniref:Uncharacterized protein n=1 Tax=Phenylobacterium glaciei TaxID=2803784 RepID=A0A974S8Y7_9CAUL|nr:hypothetical protein JKL49_26310 [Phenylobacterium glaciei]